MNTDVYPPTLSFTVIKKDGVNQQKPLGWVGPWYLYRDNDVPLTTVGQQYHANEKLPKEAINGFIVQDNCAFKINGLEYKRQAHFYGTPSSYYSIIYLKVVDNAEVLDLIAREQQVKETMLVCSDRLEELGELDVANILREHVRKRGVLILGA